MKTFIMRTSSLSSVSDVLLSFGPNRKVIIPFCGIIKLEKVAETLDDKGKKASKVLEYLETFNQADLMSEKGVKQSDGSKLFVIKDRYQDIPVNIPDITPYDKQCLQIALGLKKVGDDVVIISKTTSFRMIARDLGIEARPFKDDLFPDLKEQYTGRIECQARSLDGFFEEGKMPIKDIIGFKEIHWTTNMFLTIKSLNGMSSALGRFNGKEIVKLDYQEFCPSRVTPKNSGQRMLIEALMQPPERAPLIIAKGPAGTGKTFLSLAAALEQTIEEKSLYSRILIGAPIHPDELGYMPGDLVDKADPYILGFKDNLIMLLNDEKTLNSKGPKTIVTGEDLMERGILSIQPVETLRGASISNTIYIIDEAQNISPKTIKTIITRAGKDCKIVLLGDPSQVDVTGLDERCNGITYASEIWKDHPLAWQINFKEEESVRSPLAKAATMLMR